MLQLKQELNTSGIGKKKAGFIDKINKKITNKYSYKKGFFLATFLSLFCSSSACATNATVGTNASNTPVIVVNNQPFFPFGFYYTSWFDYDDAKRLTALRKIASAGFNVMHASLERNDGPFVDEAARLGIYIIAEFNDDTMTVINLYKNEPAIMGWLVADDADNGKKTANSILQFHNRVKTADPQHLTYLSGGYPTTIGQFTNTTDLVGMQSYPINYETLSATTYTISSAVKAAALYNRPIIANLQAFAWKGRRSPTSKEVRNMTYQALIAGVKGITYYAYYDQNQNWDMASHSDLWNGVKSLVPEIKQLSPMLLNGNLTKITTGVQDVFAGIWTYQNRAVVVVINTSSRRTRQASIALPSQRASGIEAMFSGRPSGMSVIGNNLVGSIKPQDVHVYSFGI